MRFQYWRAKYKMKPTQSETDFQYTYMIFITYKKCGLKLRLHGNHLSNGICD